MDQLTIEKMEINAQKSLNADAKKALVKIIEDEFHSQTTVYNAKAEAEKDRLLEEYRKGIGFDKLKKEYDKAVQAVELAKKKVTEAEHKIEMKGLNTNGERYSGYINEEKEPELKRAQRKINQLFKTVEEMAPNNLKNKIISRLWLADTNGEACVILRQVLGNGIIPTISSKFLLANKSE